MGIYNIHPQFLEGIRSRRISAVLFASRRYNDKPGDTMYLFTGLGTSASRLLATPVCRMRKSILLESAQYNSANPPMLVFFGDDSIKARNPVIGDKLEEIALELGFGGFARMEAFYAGKLPFLGHFYRFEWGREGTISGGLEAGEQITCGRDASGV